MVEETTKKKVLIAEDERPMANALKLKLEKNGIEANIANNGEEAVLELKNNQYDLVLLDIIMPVKDGFGVLEDLKNLKIETPVIMTSNLSQEEDVLKAKEFGAVGYFVKSNTPISEIVEKVKKALEIIDKNKKTNEPGSGEDNRNIN